MYSEEDENRDYDTRQDYYGIRRVPDEPEEHDLDDSYEL